MNIEISDEGFIGVVVGDRLFDAGDGCSGLITCLERVLSVRGLVPIVDLLDQCAY